MRKDYCHNEVGAVSSVKKLETYLQGSWRRISKEAGNISAWKLKAYLQGSWRRICKEAGAVSEMEDETVTGRISSYGN